MTRRSSLGMPPLLLMEKKLPSVMMTTMLMLGKLHKKKKKKKKKKKRKSKFLRILLNEPSTRERKLWPDPKLIVWLSLKRKEKIRKARNHLFSKMKPRRRMKKDYRVV